MVTQIKKQSLTIRKIAQAVGMTSAKLLHRIQDSSLDELKNRLAHEELTDDEADAIVRLLTVNELVSDDNLKQYFISRYSPKSEDKPLSWRGLGQAIANVQYLSVAVFNRVFEGYFDRSSEYEKLINEAMLYDLRDLDLDLKHGRISSQKKIEFLTSELYEIARKNNHIDDHMKVISFLVHIERNTCQQEINKIDKQVKAIGGLLSIAVLGVVGVAGWVEAVKLSDKLCHPGGDATVYRNSSYCVGLKTVEEFFVGKGELK